MTNFLEGTPSPFSIMILHLALDLINCATIMFYNIPDLMILVSKVNYNVKEADQHQLQAFQSGYFYPPKIIFGTS